MLFDLLLIAITFVVAFFLGKFSKPTSLADTAFMMHKIMVYWKKNGEDFIVAYPRCKEENGVQQEMTEAIIIVSCDDPFMDYVTDYLDSKRTSKET